MAENLDSARTGGGGGGVGGGERETKRRVDTLHCLRITVVGSLNWQVSFANL